MWKFDSFRGFVFIFGYFQNKSKKTQSESTVSKKKKNYYF